ncbi:MAG: hypothetical protein IT306_18360 [Chloroflexi bacterium]|nr:hypothetical protein [Chloroflexota bacterium]
MAVRRLTMALFLTLAVLFDLSSGAALARGDDPAGQVATARRAAQAPLAAATWVSSGLNGTSPQGLAVDPRTPTTMYAATVSGVFKSTDGGRTWRGGQGTTLAWVFTVEIDPNNSSILYAGTANDGIFKSTDGGATWHASNTGLIAPDIYAITVAPSNSNVVYAGINSSGNPGLYKSTNAGASWTAIGTNYIGASRVVGLLVDPTDANKIVVGQDGSFMYRSTDGGATFQMIGSGLPTDCCGGGGATSPPAIFSLVMHPTAPSTLFTGGYRGIHWSVNNGTNWTRRSTGLGDEWVNALVFNPLYPSIMYASTTTMGDPVYVTTNGGQDWEPLVDTPGGNWITLLGSALGTPPVLFAASGGDLLRLDLESGPTPIDGVVQQIGATGTYLPADPRAPAGVYRILFTFRNASQRTFADLQARITALTVGHILANRDGAPTSTPAGVGAILSIQGGTLGSDGMLSPNETFSQVVDVGLQRREAFQIKFTGIGVPVQIGAQAASERSSRQSSTAILEASAEFTPTLDEQPSPLPTPTVPTPGPQPPKPAACSPRPKIEVRTAQDGAGQLIATVTTEATSARPDNALKAVRVTGLSNATVQVVGGAAITGGSAYTPPPGQREARLLVTREQPGPMTAHLEIEDSCGTHTTFVGAGAGVR